MKEVEVIILHTTDGNTKAQWLVQDLSIFLLHYQQKNLGVLTLTFASACKSSYGRGPKSMLHRHFTI